jgi:hypothetical protein
MYVSPAEMEPNCFRQGDIIQAVPFPIIDGEMSVLSRIDHEGDVRTPHPNVLAIPTEHRNTKDCITAQIKMRLSLGAVLAHCCELELRNGRCLLPTIPVARLIPVKPSISNDESKIASLRGNKDPRNTANPGYIDYFYLAAHERLNNMEWVVDYCQISSIPGTEYATLLRRKILQLSNRDRVKFKIKLAAFMGGRLTEEELGLGLENPWSNPI